MGRHSVPSSADQARVIVIPVPYERTSSYGFGSSRGPAAILTASNQVEFHDSELAADPWADSGGIATLEPLDCDRYLSGERLAVDLQFVAGKLLDEHKKIVTLGGEHTAVIGSIRAHAERTTDLTVLQLDAHSDLRQAYKGDPWNHACTMARVFDFHTAIVQVGVRSEATEEKEFAALHRIPVFRGERIAREDRRGADWITPIIEVCARRVYITIDADVLDATCMPSTGTPEPGGLDWIQLGALLERVCLEREVIGFDFSELAPLPFLRYPDYSAAKLIYRLIGMAFPRAARDTVAVDGNSLRIGMTKVGKGVFADRDYAPGETLLVFRGKQIDFAASQANGARECDALQIGPDTYLDLDPPGVFVNHSCGPNCAVADGPRLISLRHIRAGEELRYDYSTTMDEDHWTMRCLCGARSCRKNIRDFKTLPKQQKLNYIRQDAVPGYIIESEIGSRRLTIKEVEQASRPDRR